MKKLTLSIIMFMIATSMLTSCTGDKKDGNIETSTTTATSTTADTSTTAATTLASSSSTETIKSDTDGYNRGIWEDNIYKNEHLGFTFSLPDKWETMTIEELTALASMTGQDLQSEGMVYDMFLMDSEGDTLIQLLVADLTGLSDNSKEIKEQDMLDIYKLQLESDTTAKYIFKDTFNMKIADKDFLSMLIENEDGTSQLYMVKNYDGYLATFIGWFNTENLESFKTQVEMFKAL